MNSIGSTSHSISSSLLAEISSYYANGSQGSTASSAATSATQAGDQVSFSQTTQLFQQLEKLETSNPAEFKQVLTDAASKLKTAAAQTTDPARASALNQLAGRFQTAAANGNLSALRTSTGSRFYSPGSHRHQHHGMKSTGAQNTNSDKSNVLPEASAPSST